jgi:hypothetical protein
VAPVLCGGRAISKAWDADLSHLGDGAAARWKNVAQWPAKRNSATVIDVAILDVGGTERHHKSHFSPTQVKSKTAYSVSLPVIIRFISVSSHLTSATITAFALPMSLGSKIVKTAIPPFNRTTHARYGPPPVNVPLWTPR